jgi:hypothetical protein
VVGEEARASWAPLDDVPVGSEVAKDSTKLLAESKDAGYGVGGGRAAESRSRPLYLRDLSSSLHLD